MRKLLFILYVSVCASVFQGCLPKAGCIDHTAENYDPDARENDGSCIPARKKLIGNYTYTRLWTDVQTENDSISFGTIRFTESGAANNAFFLNLNGQYILRGVIAQFDIVLDPYSKEEDYFGFPFTRTFNGTGVWLENDTVDAYLSITTRVPGLDGEPPQLTEYTQLYEYYLTKQ